MKWYIKLIIILCVIILPFIFSLAWNLHASRRKGYTIKAQGKKYKRPFILYRLYVELPAIIISDIFNREEFEFNEYGIHMFCGEQGCGKTISMVEMMLRLQSENPKCKTITNFGYSFEDDVLNDWRQLLDYKNGKQGVIVGIDEIQAWFMSGKNQLPPDMLAIVCQNRKNRRAIICTSQVFTRVNKALREQVTYVYSPKTFFGGFTVVLVEKPIFDDTGVVIDRRFHKIYCFAHTKKIREAYDTYRIIDSLSADGFRPDTYQIFNAGSNSNS